MNQCRGIPGQGREKGWIGEQEEGRGLMRVLGSGDPGKGKLFEM